MPAPEKTLEAGVRLPPHSRISPPKQGAPGRTASEAGSGRSLSGRRLSSGEEKRKRRPGRGEGGGRGGKVAARLRGAELSERRWAAAGVDNRERPGRRQGGAGRIGAAGGPYPDRISLAEEGCCETERSRKRSRLRLRSIRPARRAGGTAPAPPRPGRAAPRAHARRWGR